LFTDIQIATTRKLRQSTVLVIIECSL